MKGKINHRLDTLLADLLLQAEPQRLQKIVTRLKHYFGCEAVALLELKARHLSPVAIDGLMPDTLGRCFSIDQHPRLAAISARRDVTHFPYESTLPDPYDGLLPELAGESIPVHDCMGVSLYMDGALWGVLTLDSLKKEVFTAKSRQALHELTPLICAAVRITRLETALQALEATRTDLASTGATLIQNSVVGHSGAMVSLLKELGVVADSELPVLLLGETGVGKELFARRLHQLSRRKDKALVHVNCAALPEALAESELFGHARGAFSGAVAERAGRFDVAHQGTLFLDEVGELPLSIQAKLLRTLQEGEVQRLGEDRPRHVDVRVIAATNRNLHELVREGAFRADLYHRLSVYPIRIPPLRERGNDVIVLAGRFLEINRSRLGLRGLRLSAAAQEALHRYAWPGNVRELEHVISRAAIKAVSRGVPRNGLVRLEADMLDLQPLNPAVGHVSEAGCAALSGQHGMSLREAVETCQRQVISQALDQHEGNWARAAKALMLDASNLHKLARRLGVKKETA